MNKRNDKNSNAVLIGPLLASEVLLNKILFRKSNVYDFLKEIANRLDSCHDISATSPDSLLDLKQKFNELVSNLTKRTDENIDDDDTTLDDLLQQCIAECERVFGQRITNVSNSVSHLSTSVSGLPAKVNTISTNLSTLSSNVNGLPSNVTNLSNSLTTAISNISRISTSVSTLTNRVNSLPTNLGTITANVNTLTSSVNTISTNLNNLSSSVSGLPSSVNAISNDLTTAISNISSISANVGTLTSSVTTISNTISSLPSTISSAISDIDTLSSDIGTFKTTVISNLSQKINYSDLRDLSADDLTNNNPARAKDVKRYVSEISDKIDELSAKIDLINQINIDGPLEDMINARVMAILTQAAHDISDYYVTVDGEQYRLKFEKVIDLAQAVANIVDGIESGEIRDQNGDAYEFVTMVSNDDVSSQVDYEGFPDAFIELDNYVLSQTNNHIMLQTGNGSSSNSLIYNGSNSLESTVVALINDGFEVNNVDYQIMLKKKDD